MELIPLYVAPSYSFAVTLDGNPWVLTLHWQERDQSWYFDLSSVQLSRAVYGLRLACAVDMLAPHAIPELGGLWCVDKSGMLTDPDYLGLGTRFVLLYQPLGSPEGVVAGSSYFQPGD